MPTPRQLHVALLLPGGHVLVVGGDDGQLPLADALLYDPVANSWTATTTIATPQDLPTATILGNGKVLVTSGLSQGSPGYSEFYDPSSNSWTNEPNMHSAHVLGATATLLDDGRVLVAGGQVDIQGTAMAAPEIYDQTTNVWSLAGTMANGRKEHTATLLPSGKVLVAGGFNNNFAEFSSTELYDPATITWSAGTSMSTARNHHGAVLLPQGAVFVTGGQAQGVALQSSELYW